MQQISPYQLAPKDQGQVQYVYHQQQKAGQQPQQVKVLTSALIPQQQNYELEGSLNQTYQILDNSVNIAPKSPYLIPSNGVYNQPQQVIQYQQTQQQQQQPVQNQVIQKVQYIPSRSPGLNPNQTDRLSNEDIDNRFRLSNISSIQPNNSAYSHSRKGSDRISHVPTLHSQIVQPNTNNSQMINPLATYNQQLQIHEQQKLKLTQFQNQQAPPSMNQTFISYQKNEENESRLKSLINENEQLIRENEYYKKQLSGQPKEYQNNIALQQQVQQLLKQNESLSVQLQIQRDESAMWQNREKEMSDRCRSLYDQVQAVKGGDTASLAASNAQLKQKVFDLEQNSKLQTRQIEELNACLQVYKDSMRNQGILGIGGGSSNTTSFTKTNPISQGNDNKIGSIQIDQQKKSPNIIGVSEYIPLNQQYYSTPIEPLSQQQQNQYPASSSEINSYSYSSPKQREDMVQSIIKQYQLGNGSLSGTPSHNTLGQKKVDDYTYNTKGQQNNDYQNNHDQKMGDWKSKYDSLSQKLNQLNQGQDSNPNIGDY